MESSTILLLEYNRESRENSEIYRAKSIHVISYEAVLGNRLTSRKYK